MKVLMVLTSHDQSDNRGRKTGFWLEELAPPYYVFKDTGAEIAPTPPKGARPLPGGHGQMWDPAEGDADSGPEGKGQTACRLRLGRSKSQGAVCSTNEAASHPKYEPPPRSRHRSALRDRPPRRDGKVNGLLKARTNTCV
jgi:hypothetical protein